MGQIFVFFRSLLSYAVVFSLVFALFPFALVIWVTTYPFDKRHTILHYYSCFWGSMFIWTNPMWRVQISNRDRIKRGKPYVLVSNHQSMLDICVIYLLFKPFKWVSKSENFMFKTGAFTLALKTRTPIIPIIIEGSGKVLPKKGLFINPNRRIKMHVMEEIPVERFDQLEVNDLTKMIRGIMEDELHRIRQTSA